MVTDETNDLLEQAFAFIRDELHPISNEIEKTETLPRSLIMKLASKRMLTPHFPSCYGGSDMLAEDYGRLTAAISGVCCNTRTVYTVSSSIVGESIIKFGTEKQKQELLIPMSRGEQIGAFALSETDVGSDAAQIQTRYERVDDKYILNGRKKWVSLGSIADFFIVIATNGTQKTAFIVNRHHKGVHLNSILNLAVGKGSHLAELTLIDVEVPSDQILGGEGNGFAFVVNTGLDHGRFSVAWAALGIAQAALDKMIQYAKKRTQFGKKLAEHQLIQQMIANAVTSVHTAECYCSHISKLREAGHEDAIMETNIAKFYTSRAAVQVVNDAIQVHGANGFSEEYGLERLYREARVLEIIEGTSQIQQILIANYGLTKYF